MSAANKLNEEISGTPSLPQDYLDSPWEQQVFVPRRPDRVPESSLIMDLLGSLMGLLGSLMGLLGLLVGLLGSLVGLLGSLMKLLGAMDDPVAGKHSFYDARKPYDARKHKQGIRYQAMKYTDSSLFPEPVPAIWPN
ncbi:hypothetical protein AtubIFM57258_000644 [Aspergillus tubingensis]|nr:hypothetical protein AtubIFM57258_000644 [Aspergillus tubingensis]